MRKFLIGATAALSVLALSGGGGAAAQDVAYTFPPGQTGSSGCTADTAPPQLTYNVAFGGPFKGDTTITLSFTQNGVPFGSPIQVTSFSGTVAFPTNGNGGNNGYLADGWSIIAGLWIPGPQLMMTVLVVDAGDGDAEYRSAGAVPVTYSDVNCPEQVPPPPPQPPAPQPPPPPPPTPLPTPTPLPSTGLSTFETGMRMGALLLIGGLGFVIVARRRRFSANTASA